MTNSSLPVTDFSRSFLTFRMDLTITRPRTVSQPPPFTLNNARFPIECVCRIQHAESPGVAQEYVLGASCKAEQVNVSENIWHEPPADMCLIASREEFLVIKSWDRNNRGVMLCPAELGPQPERQAGLVSDAFTQLHIDCRPVEGRLLNTPEDVVSAILGNLPLVSLSRIAQPDGSLIELEYPVKVVNAGEREMFYQLDTGPVLFPDDSAFDGTLQISRLRLAFIAHNNSGCTELLLNVPTPIGSGFSVNHYSRPVRVRAENTLFAID